MFLIRAIAKLKERRERETQAEILTVDEQMENQPCKQVLF